MSQFDEDRAEYEYMRDLDLEEQWKADQSAAAEAEAEAHAGEQELQAVEATKQIVASHVHTPHKLQTMIQTPSPDGLGITPIVVHLCVECKLAYYEELETVYPSRILSPS